MGISFNGSVPGSYCQVAVPRHEARCPGMLINKNKSVMRNAPKKIYADETLYSPLIHAG